MQPTSWIEELHEAAIARTGYADFGDPSYRHGLLALVESYASDCDVSEQGWQNSREFLVRALTARLRTQQGWAESPNVLSLPIRRPMIIAGLPRTGTTALHRLLSQDPQFQTLELWICGSPMIRPSRDTWKVYPEYRDCVARLLAFNTSNPAFADIHELVADDPEECGRILIQSFSSWFFGFQLPSFASWLATHDTRDAYNRYIDVLRLIGANDSRQWLLKDPFHIMELSSLLSAAPDACIIQTHRDPVRAIPSFYSLCQTAMHAGVRLKDPNALQKLICTSWRNAIDRSSRVQRKSPQNFHDVNYRHFVDRPLSVVRSIYDQFGLTLSDNAEARMRDWIERGSTSRHRKHEYALSSFSLTPESIKHLFADYRAKHDLQ